MTNVMKDVAKLLGVELEEEFKVSGNNICKLSDTGLMYWDTIQHEWIHSDKLEQLLMGDYKIVKPWKQILDDVEKKYLGNIIKPFRDRIVWIRKCEYDRYGEYIVIGLKFFDSETDQEQAALPSFARGTMYQGMELGKRYTLEELGL